MRCKICNKPVTPKWNKELGEWEICNTCRAAIRDEGYFAYDGSNWNGAEPPAHKLEEGQEDEGRDRDNLAWDYSRGPRPACLDWTDEQIIDNLLDQFDDMDAKLVLTPEEKLMKKLRELDFDARDKWQRGRDKKYD